MQTLEYKVALTAGRYAFIDLGSGDGGSIDHCQRRFRCVPGLGFELAADAAAQARIAGYDVVAGDVQGVDALPPHCVSFVSAMDFLEHLPDEAAAASVLKRFIPAARDFLFIRHPSFEERDYLARLGLKLCWTDWTEHPNTMRLDALLTMVKALPIEDLAIFPRGLIVDPSSDQVVPLSAPTDTFAYDAARHAPKPSLSFDRPVFAQYDIFARLRGGMSDARWREVIGADVTDDFALWPACIGRALAPAVRNLLGFYDAATSGFHLRFPDGREATPKYGAADRGWRAFVGVFRAGTTGLGVYDPATGDYFLRHSLDEGLADVTVRFGPPGGIPIAGDWTGSGVDTIGLYRPADGQWFLRHANANGPADSAFAFGAPSAGYIPIVGDWDGDGRDSVGVYDPATATWHLRGGAGGGADASFTFGPVGGLPVTGDWDGDGRDSIGVYAHDWGLWFLRNAHANGPADATVRYRGAGVPFAARRALTQAA